MKISASKHVLNAQEVGNALLGDDEKMALENTKLRLEQFIFTFR
jgi:hypothetical protein